MLFNFNHSIIKLLAEPTPVPLPNHHQISPCQKAPQHGPSSMSRNKFQLSKININKNMQSRKVRLFLKVSEVHITAKFPCSVRMIFRVGGSEVQSSEKSRLQNGVAVLSKTMILSIDLGYSCISKEFNEKKGIITVYLVSANGTNMAGLYTFNVGQILNEGNNVNRTVGLERCPDKGAYMSINMKYQLIENDDFFKVDSPEIQRTEKVITNTKSEHDHDHFEREEPRRYDKKDTSYRKFEIRSVRDGSPAQRLNRTTVGLGVNHGSGNNSGRMDLFRSFEEDESRIVERMKLEMMDKERKLTRLEIERQNFQLQNSSLKTQLESFRNKGLNRSFRDSDENERLRKKCQSLEGALSELTLLKAKYEDVHSEKKQISKNKKGLQYQLQDKNSKIKEAEEEIKLIRKQKQEADKNLRDKTRECKEHTDHLQDVQSSLSNLQKRTENKEILYKEELKKVGDKFAEAQQQKHKMLIKIEDLKNQNEEKEAKIGTLVKEKDKFLNEDRQKLLKRYEQLKGEHEKLLDEKEALRQEVVRKTSEVEGLKKTVSYGEIESAKQKEEIERFKSQIASISVFKTKYEDELKEKNSISQQHLSAQKLLEAEIGELKSQINTYNKQVIEKSDVGKMLNEKNLDLQKKLKEKQGKLAQAEAQLQNLRKKIESVRKSQQKKSQDIQALNIQCHKLQNQVKNITISLEESQYFRKNERSKNQEQVESLKKHIKKLFEEAENSKFQLSLSKQDIMKLGQEKQTLIDKERMAQEKLQRLEGRIKQSQGEMISKDLTQKQLFENIASLEQELKNQIELLNRETDKNEENRVVQNRLKKDISEKESQIVAGNDNIKKANHVIQQKEGEIKDLTARIEGLEAVNQEVKVELGNVKEEVRNKVAESLRDKQTIQSLRKEIQTLKQEIKSIEQSLSTSKVQLGNSRVDGNNLVRDKNSLQVHLERARSEMDRYKKNTLNSATLLYQQLQKQQPTTDRVVENVFDYDVSMIQVQIITYIKQLKDSNDTEIHNMSETIKNIGQENQHLRQKNQSLEGSGQQLNEELKFLIMQKEEIDKEYELSTEKLEDLERRSYQYLDEIRQLEQRIKEVCIQNEQLQANLDFKEQQIVQKDKEIDSLNKEVSETKDQFDDELSKTKIEELDKEQRLRRELEELDLVLNNRLKEKTSMIEKMEDVVKGLRVENEKGNLSIQRLESRMEELNNELRDKMMDITQGSKRERELTEKVKESERRIVDNEGKIESQMRVIEEMEEKERKREELLRSNEREKEQLLDQIKELKREIVEKQEAIEQSESECQQLQDELESNRDKQNQIMSQKTSVSEENQSKNKQILELNEEVRRFKEDVARKEKKIEEKEQEISQLKEKHRQEKQRLEEAANELEIRKQEVETNLKRESAVRLQTEKVLESTERTSTEEYKRISNEKDELKNHIDELVQEVSTLKTRQLEKQFKIQELLAEISTHKSVISTSMVQFNKKEQDSAQEFRSKTKDQQEKIRLLEEKLQSLDSKTREDETYIEQQKDRFKESTDKLDQMISGLGEKVKQLEIEKAGEEVKNLHLNEEVEATKRLLRKQEDLTSQIEVKLKEELRRQEDLKGQIEECRRRIVDLQESSIDKEKERKKNSQVAESEYKKKEEENQELERVIERMKKDYQLAKKSIHGLEGKGVADNQTIKQLEGEIERLTRELIELETTKSKEIQDQRERLSKAHALQKETEDRMREKERELLDNQNDLQELKTMKNPAHKYMNEIKESLIKHQSQKKFLKQTLAQFQNVNRGSVEKIKSLQKELSLINAEKGRIIYKLKQFSVYLLNGKKIAMERSRSMNQNQHIIEDYNNLEHKVNELIDFGFAILTGDTRSYSREVSIVNSDATIKRRMGSKLDVVSDVSGSSSRFRGSISRMERLD